MKPSIFLEGKILDYKRFKIKEYERIMYEGGEPRKHYFDVALEMIDKRQAEAFIKTYIYIGEDNWWRDFYSESTYYRLMNNANEQLELLLK